MTPPYFSYQEHYAQHSLRGVDIEPRPELAIDKALKYANTNQYLLDIGCGTAGKTIQLASFFKTIIGLEPSVPLIKIATDTIQKNSLNNTFLIRGVSQQLPIQKNIFDVITAILTWENPSEIHRVIKQEGVVIVEGLGPNDKTTFTQFFGKDAKGYRGAHLGVNLEDLKKRTHDKWAPYFSNIEIFNQQWQTAYTQEGLWNLLVNTHSTVRNFDPINDKSLFEEAINALEQDGKIILTQNRLVTIVTGKI